MRLNPRHLLVVSGVALLAFVFSGCFGFSGLRFSNLSLKPDSGKRSKSVATITTYPLLSEDDKTALSLPPSDYPFVMIGLPSDDSVTLPAGGRVFDPAGVFGPRGGRSLVRDDVLRGAVIADGCGDANLSEGAYRLFRTQSAVNDHGDIGRRTSFKVPLKQTARTDQFAPGLDFFVGAWFDDGDGIAETGGDDLVGCSGGGFHNLDLKQVANPSPRAKRELRARAGG